MAGFGYRVLGFGGHTSSTDEARMANSAAFVHESTSTYLGRDYGSAGNRKTMTWSFWIKFADDAQGSETASQIIGDDQSGYPSHRISLHAGQMYCYSADDVSQTNKLEIRSGSRLFRDYSSWYHFVFAIDTTQAVAANRIKVWVNGTNETSRWTQTTCDQNIDTNHNAAAEDEIIGKYHTNSYFTGHLAHFHFVDGTAMDADDFGETDTTTGEWKPKLEPTVTYGTNGWFLKFEDSGALGTDSSGESNTWTKSGSIEQSISTPSNNFATWNYNHSLESGQNVITMAGTEIDHANDTYTGKITCATLGMNAGKWYWETKYSLEGGYLSVGFVRNGGLDSTFNIKENKQLGDGADSNSWAFKAGNTSGYIVKLLRFNNGDSVADMGVTPANGDIIQTWLDLDNGKAWWGINGTVMNSGSGVGVPNTGAYPHFTFTVGNEFYIPAVSLYGFNGAIQCQVNFGEGSFAHVNAVSSAVADNNSNGNFEYDPLDGFYSICTQNIKEYG